MAGETKSELPRILQSGGDAFTFLRVHDKLDISEFNEIKVSEIEFGALKINPTEKIGNVRVKTL